MARRACLSIGVSTVTPPAGKAMRFGYLDGAVVAARTIGEWALRSGFAPENVRIVTDERPDRKADPVTRERVQQAVDELFPAGAEVVEHLILAFCGHGLTDENVGSISWLFSDSLRGKYRVVADRFYEELLLHGVQRITLITDACREAPGDLNLMRFDAVRGIAVEGVRPDSPRFDRLAACQDGQLGYMVSDPASPQQPGKCIFSGVVADVLWGMEPRAISGGLITTATLGEFVRSRTAERARDYKLKLDPQCSVDPVAVVLYDQAHPPQGPPGLQPWPPPAATTMMGAAPAVPPPTPEELALHWQRMMMQDAAQSVRPRRIMRREGSISVAAGAGPLSDDDKGMIEELFAARAASASKGPGAVERKRRRTKQLELSLAANAGVEARGRAASGVQRSLVRIAPSGGANSSNLIVAGGRARLWSRGPVQPGRRTSARRGFRVPADEQGLPVLVELAGGAFTPVVPYPGLYVLVKRSEAGDVFQAYGSSGSRDAFRRALQAVTDFAAGRLGADRLDELAALLRQGKHADPVLGAICAYLYRALADYDSIRRMAWFYAAHGQPVPFDIALLGGMAVSREADGSLLLEIPAVAARSQPPGGPPRPDYVTAATDAAEARIGGRCPWLALGWDYVSLPRPEWAALVEGLEPHARDVPRRGFTTLARASGRALAGLWGLDPR